MNNETTLLIRKKKSKKTLLHYAMGSKTTDNQDTSVIRQSLSRNKSAEKTSQNGEINVDGRKPLNN